MAPETINDEKLGFEKWVDKKFNEIDEISPLYFEFDIDLWPGYEIGDEEEMSEKEMLNLPEKIGMFSFLYDSKEDIYSESDGTPL